MRVPLGIVLGSTLAATAHADPCRAIPDRGPTPAYLSPGKEFAGPVVYVGDGDSLCVSRGPGNSSWIEVRLHDFYAPELHSAGGRAAKKALEQVALGRSVTCRAEKRSYDRIVATCWLRGQRLGDLLRQRRVREGGRGSPMLD